MATVIAIARRMNILRDDNLDRYDSGIDNTRMDKGDEPEDSVTNRRAVRVIGNTGEGPKFILFEHAYLFRGPALAELSAYGTPLLWML